MFCVKCDIEKEINKSTYTNMKDKNFKKGQTLNNLLPLKKIENIKKSNKIVSKLCLS